MGPGCSRSLSGPSVRAARPLLTDAFALVRHADGSAQQTRGPSQVAGAGVGDAVVPAQVLLGRRHLGADAVTGHAVGVVRLVHHARGTAGAQNVAARFCQDSRRGGRRGNDEGRMLFPLSLKNDVKYKYKYTTMYVGVMCV